MATSSSYYINAPSLATATAVFINAGLTICAPNGFYSDGTISREQVGCVLLPQQICPSCVSYNCVSGVCIDPGDGTGTYATLIACEDVCIPISYNCVDGVCINPGDGTGTYSSLVSCESDCSLPCECHDGIINDNNAFSYYDCDGVLFAGGAELGTEICYNINAPYSSNITDVGPAVTCTCGTPPAVSYNCVSGNCINPGDGTGTYATLIDCQEACTPPETYNCISGACIDPGDGTGTYPTLGDCVESCSIVESYNCVEGTCTDPGDGTGEYATLIDCEAVCSDITYAKYIAEVRDCLDCNVVINTILVAFDDSLTLPTIGNYYIAEGGPDGYAYQVISTSTSTAAGYILTTIFGSFATCPLSCSA